MQNDTALCADLNTAGHTGDIIPSVAIDRIIAQRNAGIAAFMAGLAQIQEAQRLFKEAAARDWFAVPRPFALAENPARLRCGLR